MMFRKLISLITLLMPFMASALDPTATHYSFDECRGSAMPYPAPVSEASRAIPDSLTPVFVNHVGRHGARFLSSSRYTTSLARYLNRADSLRTITPEGRKLLALCREVVDATAGRWGALDSVGCAEQRGIASRLFALAPGLFRDSRINAISSYVPRCIASMDEFTHQLSRLDNRMEIYTSSGRQNSPLLRPWADDADYKKFIDGDSWQKVYDEFFDRIIPEDVADNVLGRNYPFSPGERRDVAQTVYKVVAGCGAIGLEASLKDYMTIEQANALWAIDNLSHYLTHSASTLSQAPMDLAVELLKELSESLEKAAEGKNDFQVMLRFAHAETMMPLLALLRLQGCYYVTNYFDTVGQHWRDFYVVPMASNLQMLLLKSKSGKLYLRTDLNETPVPLLPSHHDIYIPVDKALDYMSRCMPLI